MIRRLFPILGVTFIDIVGFSMLLPILPYFVVNFHMTPLVVGLLMSTFSLCQLLSGPVWGNASDRIGRKTVLIVSQVGATLGWLMLAYAPQFAATFALPVIAVIFVARIIEGVSGGNIGITQAYVADLCKPEERASAFGLISATFAAAMVFGPLGGGLLFKAFGFSAPFLAASALQFITLIVTIVFLPESRSKQTEEADHVAFREIFTTLRNPRLSPILLQKLALSLALYAWFACISLYLKGQLGFGLVETTQYFAAFGIVNIVSNVFGVRNASKRFGDERMAVVGLAILVVAFAFTPFARTPLTVGAIMVGFAFGMALANNGITAMISNRATEREQGTVLGVSSSLDSLSGILAPPVSTGMLTLYGSPFAGLASLVMAAISLSLGVRNTLAPLRVSADVPPDPVTPPLQEVS